MKKSPTSFDKVSKWQCTQTHCAKLLFPDFLGKKVKCSHRYICKQVNSLEWAVLKSLTASSSKATAGESSLCPPIHFQKTDDCNKLEVLMPQFKPLSDLFAYRSQLDVTDQKKLHRYERFVDLVMNKVYCLVERLHALNFLHRHLKPEILVFIKQ